MAYKRHLIKSDGGPIDDFYGPVTSEQTLDALTIHLSAAPSTAGTLSVILDSAYGEAYNAVLYSIQLQAASTTDVLNVSLGVPILPGDGIRTTYANPNFRTIGMQLLLR